MKKIVSLLTALLVMVSAFVFVVPAKGLDENLYTDLKE